MKLLFKNEKRENFWLLVTSFIMMLVFLKFSFALDCGYDDEPYLTDKIDLNCVTNTSDTYRCLSLVKEGNDVKSISPDRRAVEGIGIIDYFESKNGLLNAYIIKKDLYPHHNYTFCVYCASIENDLLEETCQNFVPVYKEVREPLYRGVWIKDNMAYLFTILIVITLVILIYLIIKFGGR